MGSSLCNVGREREKEIVFKEDFESGQHFDAQEIKEILESLENTMRLLSVNFNGDKEDQNKIFLSFCEKLRATKLVFVEPNEGSIALSCTNTALLDTLVVHNTPKEFLETTNQAEMEDVIRQIELITGYNLVTHKENRITMIRLKSRQINESEILLKDPKKVERCIREDLKQALRMPVEKINIRRIVPGNMDIYFSLSEESSRISLLESADFSSIQSLVGQTGQLKGIWRDLNVEIKQYLPDRELSHRLLSIYTQPLIINIKSQDCVLKRKFGEYMPLLGMINDNVRLKHNKTSGALEIHGPPEKRAFINSLFGNIEDLLNGISFDKIPLCIQDEIFRLDINSFWDELFTKAKEFALSSIFSLPNKLQIHSLRINPNLKKGSPAALKFYNALRKHNLDPKKINFDKIFNKGNFGWQATKTAQNVASIAYSSLDPKRRSGQCYGPGEYFTIDPNYLMNDQWGDTNTLFAFFILNIEPYYKLNSFHVVKNPIESEEIYMVPILIATFNKQAPLELIPNEIKERKRTTTSNLMPFQKNLLEQKSDSKAQENIKVIDKLLELLGTTKNLLAANLKGDKEERNQIFRSFCENLGTKKPILLEPKRDSIAFSCSNSALYQTLKASNTSKEFLETTTQAEMEDAFKQIELITGYDLITHKENNIKILKLNSRRISDSDILMNDPEAVESCVREDLKHALKVSEDKINIRRIVPGSIEIYFSVSLSDDNFTIKNLGSADFPSIQSLVGQTGQSDLNIEIKQASADKEKSQELLLSYTQPLIINIKSQNSVLKEKFGEYMPLLATLNKNVRIKYNEGSGTLEIHGPPEQRALINSFFEKIEDMLNGIEYDNIPICIQEKFIDLSINFFWNELFKKAKEFALNSIFSQPNKLQTHSLRINPNLKKGCPAATKFYNALRKHNLDPKNISFENILSKGIFGWHGTRTAQNVSSIAYSNLDPKIRNGQMCGRGEYCAKEAITSMNYYWGNTNTLFVFFILKIEPFFKFETHYVIDNPIDSDEMFMVPILIATFNNQAPLDLIPNEIQERERKFTAPIGASRLITLQRNQLKPNWDSTTIEKAQLVTKIIDKPNSIFDFNARITLDSEQNPRIECFVSFKGTVNEDEIYNVENYGHIQAKIEGEQIKGVTLSTYVVPENSIRLPPKLIVKNAKNNEVINQISVKNIMPNNCEDQIQIENGIYNTQTDNFGKHTFEIKAPGFASIIQKFINFQEASYEFEDKEIYLSPDDHKKWVVLSWGENPCDLDLHVIDSLGNHVYFSEKQKDEINLDHDITTGKGPETISFILLPDISYHFFVHHYSGIGTLTTSEAKLEIRGIEGLVEMSIPNGYLVDYEEGTGIWDAFKLVALPNKLHRIEIINKIAASQDLDLQLFD